MLLADVGAAEGCGMLDGKSDRFYELDVVVG